MMSAFAGDVAALHALVDELSPPAPGSGAGSGGGDSKPASIKLWRRTKWTLKKKADAAEIELRLDGYLRVFTMVLAIVQQ